MFPGPVSSRPFPTNMFETSLSGKQVALAAGHGGVTLVTSNGNVFVDDGSGPQMVAYNVPRWATGFIWVFVPSKYEIQIENTGYTPAFVTWAE
jgi:hypothetical protein